MSAPRELWFVAPGRVELRAGARVVLDVGQVRARALVSGISQGTELLLYRGEGPTPFDPSLDAGDAPTYPRRYGYAWVGEVTETRSPELALGTRVFALAPHGDEHCAGAPSFRRLPPDLSAHRAVLAANLETAINVVWDARVALGDRVVVLGGGIVGLLCGYVARAGGARHVSLVEPSATRRQVALALGFDEVSSPLDPLATADADVVIEATGQPSSLDAAISRARFEGVIALASFYGLRTASVSLGAEFHRRRLSLLASQVSHLPAARLAGWTFERRFELVTQLLREHALDALLGAPVPFAEAPAVYEEMARDPAKGLQAVFCYES